MFYIHVLICAQWNSIQFKKEILAQPSIWINLENIISKRQIPNDSIHEISRVLIETQIRIMEASSGGKGKWRRSLFNGYSFLR
jgi:hypothetical protein